MKTKTYNTYSLAELSAKAQERAMSKARDFIGEDWDGDCVIEDAKQMLAFAGFEIERIGFTGFWSQGDGAHFVGAWRAADVDAAAMRENAPVDAELHRIADGLAEIAKRFPAASFSVKHSGHYSHEYCTEFDVQLVDDTELEIADWAEVEKQLVTLARDAMRWIYRQLQKEYEWQTAEEQVREFIEANEYEFTQDGAMAPRNL